MTNSIPRPTSFADRVKPRNSQSTPAITVVEEENHYPFEHITFMRVGSAHAVCDPGQDEENLNLMLRVSTHIMSRYEPDLLPAKVRIEYKSASPNASSSDPLMTRTGDTSSTQSQSPPKNFEPSFLDRRWLKGLYLCVFVQGEIPGGEQGYCYFGVFADTFLEFADRYQPGQPFNPTQIKAIVLARSTGTPSTEIREFMRMKFSFDHDLATLEISRNR